MSQELFVNFELQSPGTVGLPSLYDLSVAGMVLDAWSLNASLPLTLGNTYGSFVYSSYDNATLTGLPGFDGLRMDNLDSVNWLLNTYTGNDASISSGDVQAAIWTLMGQDWRTHAEQLGPVDEANITTLYSQALANDGFVPGEGQLVGVVLQPQSDNIAGPQVPVITVLQAASLGQRVWLDANGNGLQDIDEAGVAGVQVRLLDNAGAVVFTQTTDANGNYLFTGLIPGTYSVLVQAPEGHAFTTADANGNGSDGQDSDVNPLTGQSGNIYVNIGENNHSVGAGLVADETPPLTQGRIGNLVFEDLNANGVQDAGEFGIMGANVLLKDAQGNTLASTYTDANGQYGFDVDPGVYSLQVVVPPSTGYIASPQFVSGNTETDSDIDAGGHTGLIVIGAGEVNNSIDMGGYRQASVAGRQWVDSNANGVQDEGEAGVAQQAVRLLDPAGNVLRTSTTDAQGNYVFGGLTPGRYSVQFSPTTDQGFTLADAGDDSIDSDVDPTGLTGLYTVNSGAAVVNVSAGVLNAVAPQAGSVSGRVLEDVDGNGSGDQPIAGATVVLRNAAGQVVASTASAADGSYQFTQVPAGNYSVEQSNLAGYLDVGDTDGGNPNSIGVSVSAGAASTGHNFVDTRPASLGDRVWLDANGNGQQDQGEQGAAGVTVRLLNAAGTVVDVQTTNANGQYLFSGLVAGNYAVLVDKPAGYNFTTANTGNDTSDSDVDAGTGRSATVTLRSGEVNDSVDAGLVALPKKASIGNFVFVDQNANGVQDAGDTGLAGVTVQLRNASGTVVASTVTDAAGAYRFEADPGIYTVRVVPPSGYLVSPKDQGGDDLRDSDIDTNGLSPSFTVVAGQTNDSIDAGFYKTGAIGNLVWLDKNENGIQDSGEQGVANTVVRLLDGSGNLLRSQATDSSGNYLFSDLTPGNYAVEFVPPTGYSLTKADQGSDDSKDSDALANGRSATIALRSGETNTSVDAGLLAPKLGSISNLVFEDLNYNGIQDAGEKGLAGITVRLTNASGTVLSSTTTDASGSYQFGNLAAGSYKVQVVTPSGYFITKANQGTDDARDSDLLSTGYTGTISLAAGENNSTVDAGLYRKASIGDRVWEDRDHDGIQDANEGGISGVKVKLLSSSGSLLATTTTNSNGNYLFSNLDPGNYIVEFDKSNVLYRPSWSLFIYNMNSWKWGIKDAGSNDALDSDVNNAGSTTSLARTGVITLVSGQYNNTVDAAITPIVIDLDGNGVQTVSREAAGGSFDLFGNGQAIASGWVGRGDGLLAVDKNGNGRIDDISELFGGTTQGAGFAQLAEYDSNGDGVVDSRDERFAELLVWRDANGDHSSDAGELMTLAQAGVASLSTGFAALPAVDAQGNLHLERGSATLADGSVVDMTDVYFNVSAEDAAAAGVSLPSIAELLGDNQALDRLLADAGLVEAVAEVGPVQPEAVAGEAGEALRQLAALQQQQAHEALAA